MSARMYRIEVEYKVRRAVYVYADTKAQAKARARDTAEWVDADEPNELVGTGDRITVAKTAAAR